jgi:hypothetical protein
LHEGQLVTVADQACRNVFAFQKYSTNVNKLLFKAVKLRCQAFRASVGKDRAFSFFDDVIRPCMTSPERDGVVLDEKSPTSIKLGIAYVFSAIALA